MHPMSKTLQNIMFTLGIVACVANDPKHGVEIKRKPIVFGNEPLLHCQVTIHCSLTCVTPLPMMEHSLILSTFQHPHL